MSGFIPAMTSTSLSHRLAGTAIAAVLAYCPTPLLAQDAAPATAPPVVLTTPAAPAEPVIVLPEVTAAPVTSAAPAVQASEAPAKPGGGCPSLVGNGSIMAVCKKWQGVKPETMSKFVEQMRRWKTILATCPHRRIQT